MRPTAKVTIDSLEEVEYEKSNGTKMNDLDLCLEVVKVMQTFASHSQLNISDTIAGSSVIVKVL